ncbi:3-hydroxyacyl-CoA dehydrogenase NAD-binding domain-containing protein [Natrinema gelatinilyticum]|uniref:3-hydroxyacyl-CoA dehydrogenase NAD-binding domain-containing protein n=1 Tax=Natrinema gelatinilyticum TaxID=2961571 RepID=UPI0020C37135|nr:3-hydroxyacyl-CoA dehydrogenase NAD-binding domain-containing protein [Natrinema gelatinilyticum]
MSAANDPDGGPIAVVGPGRMGIGIAQVFATNGRPVQLLDVKERTQSEFEAKVTDVRETIRSNLKFLAACDHFHGEIDDVVNRIRVTRETAVLENTKWVFEALPEDPKVKRDFFESAAGELEGSIVATTTSSISIDELADVVPASDRLLITHWLNPAFIVPLVEVARADRTDDDAVEATVELLEAVGKEPVTCLDSPGFLGSRIQAAAMNEAVRAHEDGVATPEEIDRALRTGVGFRMAAIGLIEFIDLGGVDILYYVNEYLSEELGDRFENPESVVEKMEANDLGPKTGAGYYDYGEDVDADELKRETYSRMLALQEVLENE